MKNIANIILAALWCMFPLGAYAQGSHWSCDERAFQYDMTAYITLVDDGNATVDLASYEVAAFVGNECRGVAKVMALPDGGASYGYLRIHSNVTSGETVTFKAYDKAHSKEMSIESEAMTFESLAVVGLPSAPFVLKLKPAFIPGDVNGDTRVNIIDVMAVYAYILGQQPTPFNVDAADVNNDGSVNVIDVQRIYSMILNQ